MPYRRRHATDLLPPARISNSSWSLTRCQRRALCQHLSLQRRADSVVLNDAASASVLIEKKYGDNIAKVFKESTHGQALQSAGFGDDLAAAAKVDSYPVVPIWQDRQITKLGPERER